MVDESAVSAAPSDEMDLRDDSGAIRAEIVEQVAAAVEGNNRAALSDLIGGWHEADLGDLLAALDAELRPRLIELLGAGFDFKALTELDQGARADVLEQLPPVAVILGIRELETDDAVAILEPGIPIRGHRVEEERAVARTPPRNHRHTRGRR